MRHAHRTLDPVEKPPLESFVDSMSEVALMIGARSAAIPAVR